jgi:BCD family chlorophyll transporter-like MFS transporter
MMAGTGTPGAVTPGVLTPSATSRAELFGWPGIIRLGLVQSALGCVVVLVTSTLNRVMVVEYSLPAMLPGALVALHYAVQMLRPRFGFGSDVGGRRTPWIVGGMSVLALGGVLCAGATALIAQESMLGFLGAIVGYVMVGLGVGAAGTSLLALLASRVDGKRRAAAATIMWIMMIAGFAVTSTVVGRFLDPFSPDRLVEVIAAAAAIAWLLAVAALWGVEGSAAAAAVPAKAAGSFNTALRRVWSDPEARGFTVFVFVSMLAYSAQELLLEPFAGLVFHFSVGASARLSGAWHSGVLLGMISVGILCSWIKRCGSLRAWTAAGCYGSAVALLSLGCAAFVGLRWPLHISVISLGVFNGIFAVSAIGSMMELSNHGEAGSSGIRMGLWGAAQAVAFALGGLVGNTAVDAIRYMSGSAVPAFAAVFVTEGVLFCVAAFFALQASGRRNPQMAAPASAVRA